MKKHIEISNVILLETEDLKVINGGGKLRKYGEIFGEKAGSLLISLASAWIVARLF